MQMQNSNKKMKESRPKSKSKSPVKAPIVPKRPKHNPLGPTTRINNNSFNNTAQNSFQNTDQNSSFDTSQMSNEQI